MDTGAYGSVEVVSERTLAAPPPRLAPRRPHLAGTLPSPWHPLAAAGRRCRRFSRRHQGAPSPRLDSTVRRFVWLPPEELVVRVDLAATRGARAGPMHLGGDSLAYHRPTQVLRLRARLDVPWCLGRFPIWLSVEPWWHARSVVSASLRSTHRPHYTLRYFGAAHDALDALMELIEAPIGARSLRPGPMPRPATSDAPPPAPAPVHAQPR